MLREDGRKSNQFRDIEFKIGFDKSVNGSCMYKQGLTEIVCLINGPKEVIKLEEHIENIR